MNSRRKVETVQAVAAVNTPAVPVVSEIPVRAQRRRKRNFELEGPLSLDKSNFDPAYNYYWAIDNTDTSRPGRVHQLTHLDDYDLVTPAEMGVDSPGSVVTRPADREGKQVHYLVKKPKDYYNADMQERVVENLKGIENIAEAHSEGVNKDLSEFHSLKIKQH